MLIIGIDSVQTQNKLIPWHCSIWTPNLQRLLHSTYRATQRGNKHKEENSWEKKAKKQSFWYADLIHKSSWLLSLVIQKGNRNKINKEVLERKLQPGLGLFWPVRKCIFLFTIPWLFLLLPWPHELEQLQQDLAHYHITTRATLSDTLQQEAYMVRIQLWSIASFRYQTVWATV